MTTTIISYQCEPPNINTDRANPSKENTLLAVGDGGEIIDKNLNAIDKKVNFLLSPSCFWCASCFNPEWSITKCPICHNNHIDQSPVSIDNSGHLVKVGRRRQNEM